MMKRIFGLALALLIFTFTGTEAVNVTLEWDPALTTVDGDPLGPIYCYKVFHSEVSGSFDDYITVSNGTSVVLTDLEYNKDHYFSVKTCTELAESDFSEELVWKAPVMADRDQDGISDDWEVIHFGSISIADGQTDNDANGISDQMEFIAGTDPMSPADRPVLVVSETGKLSFKALRPEGDGYQNRIRTYCLQHCDNLSSATWTAVPNMDRIEAVDQIVSYDMQSDELQGFYRTEISLN